MDKTAIIEKSKTWVGHFVIGLNLCPFAKRPFDKGQIRFEVCFEKRTEAQLLAFWHEIELLSKTPKSEISNTILVYPNSLNGFEKYLDFYYLAENLLIEQGRNNEFQLASFHPDYQFENTDKTAPSNHTNRSPFPFVHILRVDEVAEAIAHYPDVENVPDRNIQLLNELGIEGINTLLQASSFFKKDKL